MSLKKQNKNPEILSENAALFGSTFNTQNRRDVAPIKSKVKWKWMDKHFSHDEISDWIMSHLPETWQFLEKKKNWH